MEEYYIDPFIIPEKDVERCIKIEDNGSERDTEYLSAIVKHLLSDPNDPDSKVDFSLEQIMRLSNSKFISFFESIYTKPNSYNYKGREIVYTEKLIFKQSLIEKFEVLRNHKDIAVELISVIKEGRRKYNCY
jgi:hypothetical protein